MCEALSPHTLALHYMVLKYSGNLEDMYYSVVVSTPALYTRCPRLNLGPEPSYALWCPSDPPNKYLYLEVGHTVASWHVHLTSAFINLSFEAI
jgi:hypothetical protein